jgi:PAS domain S-box-containing protein
MTTPTNQYESTIDLKAENDLMSSIVKASSLKNILDSTYEWLKTSGDPLDYCFYRCVLNDHEIPTYEQYSIFGCKDLRKDENWIRINSFIHDGKPINSIIIDGIIYKKYPIFGKQGGRLGLILCSAKNDTSIPTFLWDKVILATKYLTIGIERFQETSSNTLNDAESLSVYLDQAPIGITIFQGPEMIVKYINESHRELVDYRGIVGKPLIEGLPELKGQGIVEALDMVYKSGESFETKARELRMKRQDGSEHLEYLDIIFKPILNKAGKVKGIFTLTVNVTNAIQSKQKAEDNKQKLYSMADALPDFVWMADQDGSMTYVNKATRDMTGLSLENLLEGKWLQAIHPDDREENMISWLESIKTGKTYNIEHRLLMAKGGYRWQLSQAIPQRNNQGDIIGWLGTSTDITKHKKQNLALRERVSSQLEDLKRINNQLEQKNKELGSFAYVASHDLQEPLRKIETFSTLLKKKEAKNLSEKGLSYLERMYDASGRMRRLISDILQYSKVNATQDDLEWVNLNNTLHEVLDFQSQKIKETKAVIKSNRLPTVKIIPVHAFQLLNNLVSNSLKYRKEDVVPQIKLSTQLVFDPEINGEVYSGNYNLITISDNGIGFEPEYSEKIFQVFERLHRRDAYSGTGIGLALCKRIVENYNGKIVASSEGIGSGAKMSILLPQRS